MTLDAKLEELRDALLEDIVGTGCEGWQQDAVDHALAAACQLQREITQTEPCPHCGKMR